MNERMAGVVERRLARALTRQLPGRVPAGAPLRIGVDLVEVGPFQTRFEEQENLISQLFTQDELGYANSRRRPWLHLAARFAAKEALFKALGTGLTDGLSWLDVEVTRDEAGEPGLVLSGAAQALAARQGVGRALLTLAHGRAYTIAVVILVPCR